MKGRPRLSDELKLQRNTLRKGREVNSKLPNNYSRERITVLPKAPEILTGKSLEIYNSAGLQICNLSFLLSVDINLLIRYCFYLGKWVELADDVNLNGMQEEKLDWNGLYRTHTRNEFKLMNQIEDKVSAIENKLGLDVQTRNKIIAGIGLGSERIKPEFLA